MGELLPEASVTNYGLMTALDVYLTRPKRLASSGNVSEKVVHLFSPPYSSNAIFEIVGNANTNNAESVYISFRIDNILANRVSGAIKVYKDDSNNIYCDAGVYSWLGIRLVYIESGNLPTLINKVIDKASLSLTQLTS